MKNIMYEGSAEIGTVIGKLKKGMIIAVDDELADKFAMNKGFRIVKLSPTHKFDEEKKDFIEIAAEKKEKNIKE